MYKVLSKCPVCNHSLKIIKLKCNKCNTVIENEFMFSKFESLSKDQLNFIEVFLKCRGSIKDVEKELGVSYPTVRGKLDDVVESLNLNVPKEDEFVKTSSNNEILDMLENGKITAEEAMNLLK
ncbi:MULTISPECIES: DUF2089 domain-containing protein [Clostridium]|uniref:DUF2089 domain-containing protein n=1 Tax=Clostridium senegalense TaxID=1465809 RepID=A0A6M0H5N7_9CLOT|nr:MULTISPECIES: DUF2089 domain-containing protein [Clostridium]NEU06026.1 DUF2089 domain-containing protein [Clostridium senegalense]